MEADSIIVLMPGMDGTGELFGPFIEALGNTKRLQVIRYPTDAVLSYRELQRHVMKQLPVGGPITLIAESFSGPIALSLSAHDRLNLRAVVLVCSFASQPLGQFGSVLARLPLAWLFKHEISPAILRQFLLGADAPDELVKAASRAISSVRAEVLANRLRQLLTCRCSDQPGTRVISLFSTRDRVLGKRARASIKEVCPNVEEYEVNAPHFALQAEPEQVLRTLREVNVL